MIDLSKLAQELAVIDAPDLRAIRDMTEADFSILLALHAAEESELRAIVADLKDGGQA